MPTLLEGLDDVPWQDLHDAYGVAAGVPALLRAASGDDEDVSLQALSELQDRVWQLGTVYDCTPVVVPFLARITASDDANFFVREQAAAMLAEIALADAYVLVHRRWWSSAPKRIAYSADGTGEDGSTGVGRNLVQECRRAVAAEGSRLTDAFPTAPFTVQVALLSVFAAAGQTLPEHVRADVERLAAHRSDQMLAAAARFTLALTGGSPPTEADLQRVIAGDEELQDYLAGFEDDPVTQRAVELVKALVPRVISAAD